MICKDTIQLIEQLVQSLCRRPQHKVDNAHSTKQRRVRRHPVDGTLSLVGLIDEERADDKGIWIPVGLSRLFGIVQPSPIVAEDQGSRRKRNTQSCGDIVHKSSMLSALQDLAIFGFV